MGVLANRVRVNTTTTGTGTITLGSAVAAYQTFAAGGILNGDVVSYVIVDNGNAWEIGEGTYSSTGPTLTRGPIESSNADAAINLSGGAQVFISPRAAEIIPLRGSNANGEYTRWSDGTQICWSPNISTGPVTTANGSGFLSATATWTFPISFSSAPNISVQVANIARWGNSGYAGTTSTLLRQFSFTSFLGDETLRAVAVGRWK